MCGLRCDLGMISSPFSTRSGFSSSASSCFGSTIKASAKGSAGVGGGCIISSLPCALPSSVATFTRCVYSSFCSFRSSAFSDCCICAACSTRLSLVTAFMSAAFARDIEELMRGLTTRLKPYCTPPLTSHATPIPRMDTMIWNMSNFTCGIHLLANFEFVCHVRYDKPKLCTE